jgi:hypothetical protein
VKKKHMQRLLIDFDKYCKQIGILEEEKPRLVTDRKTMDELKQTFNDKGRGRSTANNYGICYNEERVIYVNAKISKKRARLYKHVKYTTAFAKEHKARYRDILHTLVHELVHYRFTKMVHGKRFEMRIREILGGRVFPQVKLYETANNTSIQDNKSIPTPENQEQTQTRTQTEEMTPDEFNKMLLDDLVRRYLS